MKWGIPGVVVLLLAGGVFFVVEGRYLVEGGHAPWAVINGDMDHLKATLAKRPRLDEIQKAFGQAVGRGVVEAVPLLVAAGASGNPPEGIECHLANRLRFSDPKMAKLLLVHGADPGRCKASRAEMMLNANKYGYDEAPQADLVFILSKLNDSRVDLSPIKQEAQRHKLSEVVHYLEAPEQPVVAAAAVTGPRGKAGALSRDDLKALCDGKALPDAAPYEKRDDVAATVYEFERRHDNWRWPGRGPDGSGLPSWWTSFDDPSHTQLVVCIDAVDKQVVKRCLYEGPGEGVALYNATWKMTLREARTAKVLQEASFPMKIEPACASVKFGREAEGRFPSYAEPLKSFLAPFIGGPR